MNSPAIPVAAPGRMPAAEREAVGAAVTAVVASGTYVGGDVVSAFQADFGRAVGPGRYCVSLGSGRDGGGVATADANIAERVGTLRAPLVEVRPVDHIDSDPVEPGSTVLVLADRPYPRLATTKEP